MTIEAPTYTQALAEYHRCLKRELRLTNGSLKNPRTLKAAMKAADATNCAIRTMQAAEAAE